jgi:hypothetical protein
LEYKFDYIYFYLVLKLNQFIFIFFLIKDYTLEEFETFKNGLLKASDVDCNGKLSKSELKVILMSLATSFKCDNK